MAGQQQQRKGPPQSLREQGSTADSETFVMKVGVKDYITLVVMLNIFGILLYNTGFMEWIYGLFGKTAWKSDTLNTIWSSCLAMLNITVAINLSMFNKR